MSDTSETNYLDNGKGFASWFYTVDHKRIGVMYLIAIGIFFIIAAFASFLIRWEHLTPGEGIVSAHTYNVLFTLHGSMMVFLFIVPGVAASFGNFLIPLMIGAKIADPSKFCVNFMGDAAFGMSGLDLETSNRNGAPITTILLNNGTMGGYNRSLPTAMGEFGAGNMTGDYAAVAEALGGVGIRITDPQEISTALTRARQINFDEGKSVLLDVRTQQELKFSTYPD